MKLKTVSQKFMKWEFWIALCILVLMLGVVVFLLLFGVRRGHAQDMQTVKPSAGQPAQEIAPSTEDPAPALPAMHPSDLFLTDVDAYVALVKQVQELQQKIKATKEWKQYQDASDRATGMQLRIQQQIPKGWTYDQKSRMFVQVPARSLRPLPKPPAPPSNPPATDVKP